MTLTLEAPPAAAAALPAPVPAPSPVAAAPAVPSTPTVDAAAAPLPSRVEPDEQSLTVAVERQAQAAMRVVRDVDPQAWLFAQRARYLAEGTCDPYAEQTLRMAGLLPPL